MRVAIHTLGTRGDVQPFLALALGLLARGHDVLLVAPAQFERFITDRGVGFSPLPGAFLDLMETPEAKAAMAGSSGFAAGLKLVEKFKPIGRQLLEAEWAAARRFAPELLIHHPKALGAPAIGEKLGAPVVLASPLPGFTPTRAFASPLVPFRSLGPLNPLTHLLMARAGTALYARIIADWRQSALGLRARPRRPLAPAATLYAYSPAVLPRPADWPASVAVTGSWFLDPPEPWQPDAALAGFLAAGDAPVYVGFGSMPGLDPLALTRLVAAALSRAGLRGVLATGGGALARAVDAPHLHFIEAAPHEGLLPLMSACVHHGGAGTTAATLRAGKPGLICPFFGDQPFWGRVVAALGAGPAPLPARKLEVEALTAALRRITSDAALRQRAAELGRRIRAETGVATAIASLESRQLLRG